MKTITYKNLNMGETIINFYFYCFNKQYFWIYIHLCILRLYSLYSKGL